MPRQTKLAQALRDWGVEVVEHPGWEGRGNAAFNPRGVVCHHTGPGSVAGLVSLCIRGRSDLPGPLAQVVLAPDGAAHVIAAGRANHAGPGGWNGLTGNSSVFGIEAIHPGDQKTPWPAVQLAAYELVVAGMLALVAGVPAAVCGHKEWARPAGRKIDPAQIDMTAFRGRVGSLLAGRQRLTEVPQPTTRQEGGNPIVAVNRPPVKVMTHASWGPGYIVVCEDGGVFNFKGAPFFGSLGDVTLNKPIIDAEPTASGQGYMMMAADGGMFAFGDAEYGGRVEFPG